MRVLVVLLIMGVSIALFASAATAFSMPFKMQMPGHSTGLSSLGSMTKSLKLPSSSSFFKQLSIPHLSFGKNAMMSGFGHSAGQGFINPFSSLSSNSHAGSSLLAGFPMLKR